MSAKAYSADQSAPSLRSCTWQISTSNTGIALEITIHQCPLLRRPTSNPSPSTWPYGTARALSQCPCSEARPCHSARSKLPGYSAETLPTDEPSHGARRLQTLHLSVPQLALMQIENHCLRNQSGVTLPQRRLCLCMTMTPGLAPEPFSDRTQLEPGPGPEATASRRTWLHFWTYEGLEAWAARHCRLL